MHVDQYSLLIFYSVFVFFFNDTATTEIYTLSLHDALPTWRWLTSTSEWARPASAPCSASSACRSAAGARRSHSSGPSHRAARVALLPARQACCGTGTPSAPSAAARAAPSPRSTKRCAAGSTCTCAVAASAGPWRCSIRLRIDACSRGVVEHRRTHLHGHLPGRGRHEQGLALAGAAARDQRER